MSGYVNAPLSMFLIALAVICLTIPAYEPAVRIYRNWSGPRPVAKSLLRLGLLAAIGSAIVALAVWQSTVAPPSMTSFGYVLLFLGGAIVLATFWVVVGAQWIAPQTLVISDDIFDAKPPPKRALTDYEIEQKLRPLDALIALLRDPWPLYNGGMRLASGALDAYRNESYRPVYVEDLLTFAAGVKKLRAELAEFSNAHVGEPEVAALARGEGGQELQSAVEQFTKSFLLILQTIGEDSPKDAVSDWIGPRSVTMSIAVNATGRWRIATLQAAMKMKKEVLGNVAR